MTTPVLPSMLTSIPVTSFLVQKGTETAAGIPSSRETMAACEMAAPVSPMTAPALRNKAPHDESVVRATRTSPGSISTSSRIDLTTLTRPRCCPGETPIPTSVSPTCAGSRVSLEMSSKSFIDG